MPNAGFNLNGEQMTGRIRIRNRFLFGAVVEQMIRNQDGETRWVRLDRPYTIASPLDERAGGRKR